MLSILKNLSIKIKTQIVIPVAISMVVALMPYFYAMITDKFIYTTNKNIKGSNSHF